MYGLRSAILVCLVVAALHAAAAVFVPTVDSPWILMGGEIALSESRTPPPPSAVWKAVSFPDSWRLKDRYVEGISAWYRMPVAAKRSQDPYVLYLWRFSMNVEAYFNDEFIGTGGSFEEPIARNWNRPLLFQIPESAWRDGDNFAFVHLRVYPGWGTFTPPALGPMHILEPAYDQRYFHQITLSQYSLVVTLVVMVLGFVFWSVDWRDRTYLFFALASAAWSVYSLNLFIQHIPVSAKTWWWFVHTMIDVFNLMLVCFAHRLLQVRRHGLELTMAATVVTASCLYAVWDLPTMARYVNGVHALMLLWQFYLIAWLVTVAVRRRSTDAIVFGISLAIVLALGVHDVFLNSLVVPELWRTRFFLLQFGAPVMLLVLVVHLALRLSRAVNETRTANVRLESRVREVTRELEQSFAEKGELQRRQVALAERDRIYQDLHDDVGARLLSLVYAAGEGKVAQLARDSLSAIRSIVSSDRIEGGQLGEVAADWRAESEERCRAAGFELRWQEDFDRSTALSGLQRYHLDHVLRELLSNALRHSGGHTVTTRLTGTGDDLVLTFEDDGCGFADESVAGNGMTGIRRRVRQLGGIVSWGRSPSGGAACRVRVPIPPNGG